VKGDSSDDASISADADKSAPAHSAYFFAILRFRFNL
jgi:hypothetical protein